MDSFTTPDSHHVRAAIGWLELGDAAEALVELDKLSESAGQEPDVLELRWAGLAQVNRWEDAAKAARALIGLAPDRASGWLHHAYALRRSSNGGVLAAFNALAPVATQFPHNAIIPYNLACYSCQLDRDPAETLTWLRAALRIGGKDEILALALVDPDLAAIRPAIEKLALEGASGA